MKSDPQRVPEGVKSPQQVEFAELVKKLKEKPHLYDRKRIGKVCAYSDSMISQILNGLKSPSERGLMLLRKEYLALTEPAEPGRGIKTEPDELREQIDELEKFCPSSYNAARLTVQALHKAMEEAQERKPTNSEGKRADAAVLALVEKRAAGDDRGEGRRVPGSSPEPGAGAGSGVKPELKGRTQRKRST